jgi:hypothetical protein
LVRATETARASINRPLMVLRPRLVTSYTSLRLLRAASAGRSMKKSASYSTFPAALRGALSMFTIALLRRSAGSSSPLNVPFTRSYAPVSPNAAPSANGSTDTMVISVRTAAAGAAARASAQASAGAMRDRVMDVPSSDFRLSYTSPNGETGDEIGVMNSGDGILVMRYW